MSSFYFLPEDLEIDVRKLASIFKDTAASYKFLWFISLLQLVNEKMGFFSLHEIASKMIANAWYPVNHCHLNLGKKDQMGLVIECLIEKYGFEKNDDPDEIEKKLNNFKYFDKREIRSVVSEVPYHFLSPWVGCFRGRQHHKIYQELSNNIHKNCPYRIVELENQCGVIISKQWEIYFKSFYSILMEFAYFNFATYLQDRNPEVPGILYKMKKPKDRQDLIEQTNFWKTYMKEAGGVRSIYTGEVLHDDDKFALDHFIPWSYVAHNQVWNLAPIENSINSKKSNKLPSFRLIEELSDIQFQLFSFYTKFYGSNKFLEDYAGLGYPLEELSSMGADRFKDIFIRKVKLIRESASRMGFLDWTN